MLMSIISLYICISFHMPNSYTCTLVPEILRMVDTVVVLGPRICGCLCKLKVKMLQTHVAQKMPFGD